MTLPGSSESPSEAQVQSLVAFNPEPASADSDNDSAYGDNGMIGDDTRTLSTYITDYRFEHGRRYHAYQDGAYWGPNDEHARDVEDIIHHIYLLTLSNKLHLAPVRDPQHVLDVGCGTGAWAIDFADENISAHVIGNDLSPIQPEFIPTNCTFEVDDFVQQWTHPENHFDFIHARELFGCFPDWDVFFEQAYRHVKPGGWVEVVEHSVRPASADDTVGPDHFYNLWGDTVEACGQAIGKPFTIWEESKERMERAGFKDVHEFRFRWPIGTWCKDPKLKEIGRWNQLRLHDGCEGMMLRLLTTAAGMPYEKAQSFLSRMRDAITDPTIHAHVEGSIVYGRKPLNF